MKLLLVNHIALMWICLFSLINLAHAYPPVPDSQMTPGSLCSIRNPDYAYDRFEEKIPYCERNVNRELKQSIYAAYQIPGRCQSRYTIDHFIPLSIGGDNSATNLWPEHRLLKETRPYLEQDVFDALNRGEITQRDAIAVIIGEKTAVNNTLLEMDWAQGCDSAIFDIH